MANNQKSQVAAKKLYALARKPCRARLVHLQLCAQENAASAISVMGASGRAKIWRYNSGANLYAE
jgi:hypothetical protein